MVGVRNLGPTDMSIQVRNVSKSFKYTAVKERRRVEKEVFRNASLVVENGDSVAIIGENASGKTTIIRLISTLLIPDSGEIQVAGYDTVKEETDVKKRISVSLNTANTGFFPKLNAFDNLMFYAVLNDIPRSAAKIRIGNLLQEFRVETPAKQFQMFSTGMRKRLSLIRTFLSDAPVLLLDEPTLGVDPWNTELIHSFLKRIKPGKTLVVTTNNMDEAHSICGKLYKIEEGNFERV